VPDQQQLRDQLLLGAESGKLNLRHMRSSDLSQVVQIESNAQVSPWGRISFEESLTKQHICRLIMHDIVDIAAQQQLAKIFLEVRASNKVAQDLYLKWQFKQISLRKQYYRVGECGVREDAFVFMRKMEEFV